MDGNTAMRLMYADSSPSSPLRSALDALAAMDSQLREAEREAIRAREAYRDAVQGVTRELVHAGLAVLDVTRLARAGDA